MWELSDNKGIAKNKELERLDMYPILNADTLRMGFARVGKRRITYIRDGVRMTDEKLSIRDYTLSVVINFPSFESHKVNIKIDFKNSDENSIAAHILFDGTKYRIVNKEFQPSCSRDFIQEIEHGLFKRHQQFLQVFKKFFTPFRFAKLHREDKNAKEFLRGERYRVSLIEFANNPFLIVKSIDEKDL